MLIGVKLLECLTRLTRLLPIKRINFRIHPIASIDFGAEGGVDQSRLERRYELASEQPGYWWFKHSLIGPAVELSAVPGVGLEKFATLNTLCRLCSHYKPGITFLTGFLLAVINPFASPAVDIGCRGRSRSFLGVCFFRVWLICHGGFPFLEVKGLLTATGESLY